MLAAFNPAMEVPSRSRWRTKIMTKDRLQQIIFSALIPLMGYILYSITVIQSNRFTDADGDLLRDLVQGNASAVKTLTVLSTQQGVEIERLVERIDSFWAPVFDNTSRLNGMVLTVGSASKEMLELRQRLEALLPQLGTMSGQLTRIETILEDRPPKWLVDQVQANKENLERIKDIINQR